MQENPQYKNSRTKDFFFANKLITLLKDIVANRKFGWGTLIQDIT